MAQTQPQPLVHLTPLQQFSAGKLALRLPQLFIGLIGFGVAVATIIQAGLGAMSWDVLTLGLMNHVPLSYGALTVITSILVLLLWIPLKEMPGLGTIANAFVVGISSDLTLKLLPEAHQLGTQIIYLAVGLLLFGFFDALYIGAQFGSGPRDGLMTGLVRVTGRPVWVIRTALEVSVVLIGILAGGDFGIGTILLAFTAGPLVGFFLPKVTVGLTPRRPH
ncbi:MAG: hypothetical protein Q3974_05005 [Rothia sp. (in: high G+C Gram-positive bacteria)]|nr:hypothetical protein [Rothia sp. (in: high G+C Gram-positive bacteria)]